VFAFAFFNLEGLTEYFFPSFPFCFLRILSFSQCHKLPPLLHTLSPLPSPPRSRHCQFFAVAIPFLLFQGVFPFLFVALQFGVFPSLMCFENFSFLRPYPQRLYDLPLWFSLDFLFLTALPDHLDSSFSLAAPLLCYLFCSRIRLPFPLLRSPSLFPPLVPRFRVYPGPSLFPQFHFLFQMHQVGM